MGGQDYFILDNYKLVLQAGESAGVPKEKLVMGFKPGFQENGGVWEGFDIDFEVIEYMQNESYGGAMWFALNDPTPADQISDLSPTSNSSAYTVGTTGENAIFTATTAQ